MMKTKQDHQETQNNYARIYKTFCLYLGLVTLGFCGGIYGPTFLHMQYVLDTDTQGLGLSFIGENLGYLIGSILCGSIFDRFNQELQLFLACFSVGFSIGVSPFVPSVYYYYVFITVQNIFNGFIDSSAPSYTLYLWSGHRFKEALVQAVHASWSFGSFICPFIVIPFLYDLTGEANTDTNFVLSNQTVGQDVLTEAGDSSANSTLASTNETIQNKLSAIQHSNILTVRYAYAIVGATCVLSSLFFLIAFLKGGLFIFRKQKKRSEEVTEDLDGCEEKIALQSNDTKCSEELKEGIGFKAQLQKKKKCLRWILVILLFLYTTLLFWQDYVINLFLSALVLEGLHWKSYKGPLLTSVYRGTHGLGRFIGIFIAAVLSPVKMLLINMILAISSLTLFVCCVQFSESELLIWISVAAAGFAYSTTLPSIILWGAQHIQVTAAYSSMFLAATSIGGMTGSSLAAFLFQHYGHIYVYYISLAASLFNLILFFFMLILSKNIVKLKTENEECNRSGSGNMVN